MRHMEIQRGKEGMKSKMFNAAIGATAGCTLRLLLNSIADEEKGLKHGIRGDAWFGSVRAAAEISRRGHEAVFQIKQNHGLYPKAFIEETLKEAPGGVHIVLEGKTQCEVPLIAIGYRYSRKTILFFLLTKGAGSTIDGDPYEMKFTDSYGNIVTRFVDRPDVISTFFKTSNAIDTHNQLRQDLLQLEKKWLTKNPFFRLTTTLISINVTDAFLLSNHHKIINSGSGFYDEKKISIQRFAGILSYQLLKNAKSFGCSRITFMPEEVEPRTSIISELSSSSSDKPVVRSLQDANGKTHYLVKFDVTKNPSGRSRTKKRKCKKCLEHKKRQDVSFYCITCGENFSFCSNVGGRDCFKSHVTEIRRNTRHTS
jgi:hypothetical protein